MTKLTVLHYPNPNLRKKAISVEVIDEYIKNLANDMVETMYSEGGIGLAATQVDVHKRVVVMDLSENKDDATVLVNPEITTSEGRTEMQEGCLSVPEVYETIERAESINYFYLTLDGKTVQKQASGLLAVCVQHEIDHLNGKLFIDYLSPLKRQRLKKKTKKQDKSQHQVL